MQIKCELSKVFFLREGFYMADQHEMSYSCKGVFQILIDYVLLDVPAGPNIFFLEFIQQVQEGVKPVMNYLP